MTQGKKELIGKDKVEKRTQTTRRTLQRRLGLCLMALLSTLGQPVLADTITIGKGSGIVWEGMPFTVSNTSTVTSASTETNVAWGVASFIKTPGSGYACTIGGLTTIAGYLAYRVAPGVGIIPRANVSANYVLANGTTETLTGTIGLPETRAVTSNGDIITNPTPVGSQWCLPPRLSTIFPFYKVGSPVNATATGNIAIVADGTQTSQSTTLELWFETAVYNSVSNKQVIPAGTILRISTLECSVNTPVQINFGIVARNIQNGAELSSLSYPLTTQCSQDAGKVNANINVQFRALTGLYGGAPTRLALSQGGGYITGEIDKAVTGSGSCTGVNGVPFNNTQLKVGSITNAQASQNIVNQVIWRLCSGGSSLPTGNVSAAAEMLVTFN